MGKRQKWNISMMKSGVLILVLAGIFISYSCISNAATFTPPTGVNLITKTEYKIAPGINETEIVTNNDAGNQQKIDYVCEVDLKNVPTTKIISSYGNYNPKTWSMATLGSQVTAAENNTGLNVVAGINADFFNMTTGEPIGALVMEGITYHPSNDRPYFAILKDGTAEIREGNIPLDDVQSAVGGDCILVKDGVINNNVLSGEYASLSYSRTAIGIKEDGSVLTFTTHGANAPISCGQSYKSVAEMMVGLGCKTVLNLDGGGSSTYGSQREGSNQFVTRNSPSDGTDRLISSTLLIVSTATPSGEFDHAVVTPKNEVYTPNTTIQFSATGVDSSGGKAEIPSTAKWMLDNSSEAYGSIDQNGSFISNGQPGEVKVNLVDQDKIVGESTIIIAAPDHISFKQENLNLGFEKTSNLGLTVTYMGRTVNYKDGDFQWTQKVIPESENTEEDPLGTFTGNLFTSKVVTAEGQITATSAFDETIKGTLNIKIGTLPKIMMDFEDYKDPVSGTITKAIDYWTITRALINPSGGNILQYTGELGANAKLTTGSYGRGGNESAAIVDIASGKPVRFGNNSLELNYDFTNPITATEGACFGFCEATQQMEGNPTAIGAWVYAPEGTPNFWLRIRVRDGNGNVQTVNFTQEKKNATDGTYGGINWTGWKYVEASLENLVAPYSLIGGETIRLMYLPGNMGEILPDGTILDKAELKGSIYIDNLQFVYGANVADVDSPAIDSISINNKDINDGDIVESNNISIKSMFHDPEGKYYEAGIDPSTVDIYIDGKSMREKYEENGKFILHINDGAVYLNDITLTNGAHMVTTLVRDNFGNEAKETKRFIVEGDDSYTKVMLEPALGDQPIINSNYNLELNTNNIGTIQKVSAAIEISKEFKDGISVNWSSDYDGTWKYDAVSKQIQLEATRKADAVSSGEGTIATITFKIPTYLQEGTKFTYQVDKGEFTYSGVEGTDTEKSFSTLSVGIALTAPYKLQIDDLVVGSTGKIFVYDNAGNPVSSAGIYDASSNALIARTNAEGYIDASYLCNEVKSFALFAKKDSKYSFIAKGQSLLPAGEDAKPFNITHNVTSNSSTTKNITWFANPIETKAVAQIQIATTENYNMQGTAAFKTYDGTSKTQKFTGSSDLLSNRYVRINQTIVNGLSPNTEYTYRVGDGEVWSDLDTFTLTRVGSNTNFFILGDMQETDENQPVIINNIANGQEKYAFGVQTGDLVETASTYQNWSDGLNLLSRLGTTDILHAIGNHELNGDTAGIVSEKIYNMPNKNHYSVEYGNVYIATLSFTDSQAQMEEDLQWLIQDAKASKATWKVVVTHQPPYYTNPTGGNEMINQLLPPAVEEAGIDFVFSGHDHSYARTSPLYQGEVNEENGVVYYIVGTTGEKKYGITINDDFHFVKANQDFNGLYITVSATDEEFTVNTREYDGSIVDTYTKSNKQPCVTDGHKYVYDGQGYLTCSVCNHDRTTSNYTGFAKDLATGREMYFLNGEYKTGWFVFGVKDIYHFSAQGLAEKVTITNDTPTTCTKQGSWTATCECGETSTQKYERAPGHFYEDINGEMICKICGHKAINLADAEIKLSYESTPYVEKKCEPKVTIEGLEYYNDYTVQYINNVNVGKATVIISGRKYLYSNGYGGAIGTATKTFIIRPKSVTTAKVDLSSQYNTIKATWSEPAGATRYLVEYKRYGTDTWYKNYTSNNYWIKENLSDGKKYVVRVKAYANVDGKAYYSSLYSPLMSVYTLSAPTLSVAPYNTNYIKLSWNNIAGESGYNVYRATLADGEFSKICSTRANETSLTCRVEKGKVYLYKIRSYKVVDSKVIYGPYSATVKIKR